MEMFIALLPMMYSYGVYISQLICFGSWWLQQQKKLTSKLLKQVYWYHKLRKAFSKSYYRHSDLIVKYNICFKTLLQQGISELVFYGDLVF